MARSSMKKNDLLESRKEVEIHRLRKGPSGKQFFADRVYPVARLGRGPRPDDEETGLAGPQNASSKPTKITIEK